MKTANDPRHQERQKIVQELFAWDAHQKSETKSKSPLSEKSQKIVDELSRIDKLIKTCAPEWEIERINQTDLAVLRLGIYELVIDPETPAKVVIDEGVELAKEFGSENSPSFVNGALGKALLLPERLISVISTRLGVEEEKLTPEASLENDLNATDLEISDLLTTLEKEYNISFPQGVKIETVGELVEFVEEQTE